MPWVSRDEHGRLNGAFANEQSPGQEFLPADNQELVTWLEELNKPPIAALSRRQFYQILAVKQMITEEEALAAVQHGEIPAQLQQFVNAVPADHRFSTKMLLAGASEFDRHHPLSDTFGHQYGLTDQQLDEIWRQGAEL